MKIRKMLLLVVFIILSMPLSGYAAEYTIYVWGNADVTANMLHAVSRMMRGEDFNNLFKITALISIVVIVLSLMSDKNFSPFLVGQKIILVILVQVLLATSVDRVKIVDKLGNINNNFVEATIDNVPTVVAFPLYFFSQIDQSLRIMFRDALNSTPGAVQAFNAANGMPVTTALSLVQSASTFKIIDINFMKTFDSYMENCIRPDVITGYIDLRAIGNSNDIWQALSRTKHGSRIANDYITPPVGNNNSIDGTIKSCTDVYDVITNALNNIGANHLDQLRDSLGLSAQTNMEQILGSSASMTFNYQQNGSSLLKQSMMVNAFNDSYMTVAQATGVDASALGYGMAKAQEVSRLNSTMSGIMAKKYLPLAKSYLTIIFIVIIPLIFLIALATGTIKKPIGMIVMMLMAISLWGVGEQILDYIILVRTHSLFPNGLQAINLITQPAVDQAILDSLSLSYGMYWMIPTLAIAIASMSGYAAANMMGGISGRVSSGVGSAASEAATGSASYGIVRADMINTNKYDTTQTMSVGQSLSSINNSKNETYNTKTIGHENISKDNTINENKWETIYGVNDKRTGDIMINGELMSGEFTSYGKFGNAATFEGINKNTGEKISLEMTDVKFSTAEAGEHNQLTTVTGNVVNSDAISGNTTTKNINSYKTNAGNVLNGYNAANELLAQGIYEHTRTDQGRDSYLNNMTNYQNSFVSKSGSDELSEQQQLKASINATASVGLNIFGTGGSVGASGELAAQLAHSSRNLSTADLNMAANKAIFDGLEADKAAGLFNVNGQFSEEKYNKAAQIRYGTYNAMVTGEISNVYGPGNLSSEAFNAIKGNLEKVDKVLTDHAKDRSNNSNIMDKP